MSHFANSNQGGDLSISHSDCDLLTMNSSVSFRVREFHLERVLTKKEL